MKLNQSFMRIIFLRRLALYVTTILKNENRKKYLKFNRFFVIPKTTKEYLRFLNTPLCNSFFWRYPFPSLELVFCFDFDYLHQAINLQT